MTSGGRPAVFLDRDGTLNRAFDRNGVSVPPRTEDQLEILPGVPEALTALREAGFVLVVVTNQPDVARGTLSRSVAERINARLCELLEVDALMCCFHDDGDNCQCRKPRPGMIWRAARQLGLDLSRSFVIGDRWRDTETGRNVHCTTVQINTAVGEGIQTQPDFWAADLVEAANIVLRGKRPQQPSA